MTRPHFSSKFADADDDRQLHLQVTAASLFGCAYIIASSKHFHFQLPSLLDSIHIEFYKIFFIEIKMSSESYEFRIPTNASLDTVIFTSGSSLIDMLNKQTPQSHNEDTKSSQNKQIENDQLSTLFNTTGRERNSTGPLKQWLYEHQDHPCN